MHFLLIFLFFFLKIFLISGVHFLEVVFWFVIIMLMRCSEFSNCGSQPSSVLNPYELLRFDAPKNYKSTRLDGVGNIFVNFNDSKVDKYQLSPDGDSMTLMQEFRCVGDGRLSTMELLPKNQLLFVACPPALMLLSLETLSLVSTLPIAVVGASIDEVVEVDTGELLVSSSNGFFGLELEVNSWTVAYSLAVFCFVSAVFPSGHTYCVEDGAVGPAGTAVTVYWKDSLVANVTLPILISEFSTYSFLEDAASETAVFCYDAPCSCFSYSKGVALWTLQDSTVFVDSKESTYIALSESLRVSRRSPTGQVLWDVDLNQYGSDLLYFPLVPFHEDLCGYIYVCTVVNQTGIFGEAIFQIDLTSGSLANQVGSPSFFGFGFPAIQTFNHFLLLISRFQDQTTYDQWPVFRSS